MSGQQSIVVHWLQLRVEVVGFLVSLFNCQSGFYFAGNALAKDLQDSFYFLFLCLTILTMVYIILMIKAILTRHAVTNCETLVVS